MSINIGLDIGAVSLKLAAMEAPGDAAQLAALTRANDGFLEAHFQSKPAIGQKAR
jgi:hypothetical protein